MQNAQTPEQKEAARQKATLVVKAGGAFLMIAAVVIGFDIGAIATQIGLADGFTEKIIGGALFAMGIADFFIIPAVLFKAKKG